MTTMVEESEAAAVVVKRGSGGGEGSGDDGGSGGGNGGGNGSGGGCRWL